MTFIYRENCSFLRKQSLLCASSGFSLRFALQESIGLPSMGFECPSSNFKNCIKHVFACIVLKSTYLKACQGRQLKNIEIIFLSEIKVEILTQKQNTR